MKTNRLFKASLLPAMMLAAGLVLADAPAVTNAPQNTSGAPPPWAEPVFQPGLPNLHKVTDALYRGAQPTEEGMDDLRRMGIKTVINLCAFHSDRDKIEGLNLTEERIYMKTWHPEDEDVARFLRIVADTNNLPVFVHCRHGADRTGAMCAVYRIAVCGWSKDEAIAEMTQGGFGFHPAWTNLIEYIRDLDVGAMKQNAGLDR